ncbi:FMN-dependent NADH-azoreductase [Salinarimonas ramus]|uniref:FMN dependent NADH:quinone oxidoreductase n=1 Tax=Salinarimonas ramus TaxID=690164 RepID=A0A917QFS4_9HYPH|nr:FMN-dependent NADH-azoreductase [Salinarimonas ramus]
MKILHLNASTRGPQSESLAVAQKVIETLGSASQIEVDSFDLFGDDLPAFDADAVGGKMALFTGAEATPAQKQAWETVKAVFERFAAADVYVLNVPLWNNGIPYVLKQFIDVVTQPGWTFGFDMEKGYTGLMTGKRAFVVYASGVYHENVPANFGSDFATPYLDDWFKFIGVHDIEHIHVAPTVVNADFASTKAAALAEAEAKAKQLLAAA